MKRMVVLAVSFGLIVAGVVSVTAASLPTDQVMVKKSLHNANAQQFRDAMKFKGAIKPQKP